MSDKKSFPEITVIYGLDTTTKGSRCRFVQVQTRKVLSLIRNSNLAGSGTTWLKKPDGKNGIQVRFLLEAQVFISMISQLRPIIINFAVL